jgi:hypothetical protein
MPLDLEGLDPKIHNHKCYILYKRGSKWSPYEAAKSAGHLGSKEAMVELALNEVQADPTNAEPWMRHLVGKKRTTTVWYGVC